MHRPILVGWAKVLLLTTLAGTLAYVPLAAAESLWVSFYSAGTSPSSLRRAALLARGQTAQATRGTPIRGLLALPEGKGPFPAVVLMHDCRGLRQFQREWVRKLANWGYAALLVGSFYSRYAVDSCREILNGTDSELGTGQVSDAYGALEYLAGLKQVDMKRVGFISWDRDNSLSTVNEAGFHVLARYRFAAAVAITPSCRHSVSGRFTAPVLVLAAGLDDWTSLEACQRMVEASRNAPWPVTLKVYPQAWHGFDDPLVRGGTFLSSVYNPNRTPALGATLRYDRRAHEDSISRIQAFLQRHLTPAPTVGLEPGAHPGTWAIDPYSVGADLPPAGRSVFDQLFSRQGESGPRYDVPFPLSKVIERIRTQLGDNPVAISSGYGPVVESGMRKVLIPLGRSLQRFAAAPNFFASPRVVIAVDGEPREIVPGQQPLRLNDRLFLGYQEQARVLEVISYNEQARRFEFQVVDDYAEGLEPKVYYANRAVCRSCHQNGSPIFSKAGWDETNGNILIAERLGEVRKTFYGLGFRSGTIGPAAVDNATDRANLFSVHQLLWRKACGDDTPAGRRCRAAAVIAMLQQRLSASTAFDRQARRYRQDYLNPVAMHWRSLWPDGLLVPNPNIPNREPLLTEAPAAIPAELDPLRLRPPLEVLKAERPKDLERMITGLAEDLPAADMLRLDRELFVRGARDALARRYRIGAVCTVMRRGLPAATNQVRLDCDPGSDADSGGGRLKLQLEFSQRGNRILNGLARRIEFDATTYFAEVGILAGKFRRQGGQWVAELQLRHQGSGRHVRLAAGHALEKLRIVWPAYSGSGSALPIAHRFTGRVEAQFMDDFSPLISALRTLRDVAPAAGAADPLRADRFDAVGLMQALMPALGLAASNWCCDRPRPLPPAVAHSEITTDAAFKHNLSEHGALNAFIRNCSACHRTRMSLPPNYLMGDKATVRRNIAHCAERIYVRLSMWDLAVDERPKSPMPPPHSLKARGHNLSEWRASRDLATLKTYVARILKVQRGNVPTVGELLRDGYDATRSCLDMKLAGTPPQRN